MKTWLFTKWDRLRSSYWFIPSLMAFAAIILSVFSISADRDSRYDALRSAGWIYTGGAEGARAMLSVIAGSIITVAGTTFSITIAALSLASAQFGPRLLHNFMRDTGNQVVLGTFTSTFLYCLLILRTIRGLEEQTYVPHISISIGVALAVVCVGVLIYFIHHVAESIQIARILELVGEELQSTIERLFPEHLGEPADEPVPLEPGEGVKILAQREGYIQGVDDDTLMNVAERLDIRLHLIARPGDFLVPGVPLAIALPSIDSSASDDFRAAFAVGHIRTPHQDAVFAFLQISEIGVRALSPGINDPFTAVMCIDRVTAGMISLAERSLPSAVRCNGGGKVRIIAKPYTYSTLVEAGYRHIRQAAAGQWYVCDYLREKVRFVIQATDDPHFRQALEKELAALGQ